MIALTDSDALHRQISIVHVKCKLFRKKELTSVEGSRRASGAHGSRAPIGECTARANWLVHSLGVFLVDLKRLVMAKPLHPG